MAKKNISDLRETLFDTIEGLKSGTIDVDTAKTIRDIGQVIVNSAKVEVDMLKDVGGVNGSNFIPFQTTDGNPQKALMGGRSDD